MILDPDILILDDSLSAVDAKTEYAIIDNLKETRKDKTTIITAHRLSAVVHADLIFSPAKWSNHRTRYTR